MFTTCESTTIDYCREREAFGHPMLCLRLLSLHNALRRTALRLGCEIVSGVSCEGVRAAVPAGEGGGKTKRAALSLVEEGGEKEEEEVVVTADFVVGADGLKSVVRAGLGGEFEMRHFCFFHKAMFLLLRVFGLRRREDFRVFPPTFSI